MLLISVIKKIKKIQESLKEAIQKTVEEVFRKALEEFDEEEEIKEG